MDDDLTGLVIEGIVWGIIYNIPYPDAASAQ